MAASPKTGAARGGKEGEVGDLRDQKHMRKDIVCLATLVGLNGAAPYPPRSNFKTVRCGIDRSSSPAKGLD